MNDKQLTTTIRIDAIVKRRLDAGKRSKSYSKYIDECLRYFEVTGIEPSSIKIHPGVETVLRVESVIAIIKNIEKTKLNPMLDLIKNFNPNYEKNTVSQRESGVTDQEVEQMAELIENMNKQLKEQRETISNLEMNNTLLKKQEKANPDKELIELIETITSDSYMKKSTFGTDYTISKSVVDSVKERILKIKSDVR